MSTEDKVQKGPSPSGTAKETDQAPQTVGRSQPGEKLSGSVTTRNPRGVGELASDAVADDAGLKATQEAVRKQVDADVEKGYRGQQADPTPNENYTVAGVTKGAPTPETTVYTPQGQ